MLRPPWLLLPSDATAARKSSVPVVGLRGAVHAQEHQGRSGGPRVEVRRRAGPGVPRGDEGARAGAIRPELPAHSARLSLSVRPHARGAGGGVRGRARERADEARRRDRRAQGVGRGARPAGHLARLRGRAGWPRDSRHRRAQSRGSSARRRRGRARLVGRLARPKRTHYGYSESPLTSSAFARSECTLKRTSSPSQIVHSWATWISTGTPLSRPVAVTRTNTSTRSSSTSKKRSGSKRMGDPPNGPTSRKRRNSSTPLRIGLSGNTAVKSNSASGATTSLVDAVNPRGSAYRRRTTSTFSCDIAWEYRGEGCFQPHTRQLSGAATSL